VPGITVHGARKTLASILAALDVYPRVTIQILRHTKSAIMMESYTEVPSAATRAALRKLATVAALMLRLIALIALAVLGVPGVPCHGPCHAPRRVPAPERHRA